MLAIRVITYPAEEGEIAAVGEALSLETPLP